MLSEVRESILIKVLKSSHSSLLLSENQTESQRYRMLHKTRTYILSKLLNETEMEQKTEESITPMNIIKTHSIDRYPKIHES